MDWVAVAKKAADLGLPILGTALGGPGGGVIGKALAAAIGASTEEPGEVLDALVNDAKARQEASKFQAEHEIALRRLGLDEKRLNMEDIANARAREIAVRDPAVRIIAFSFIAAFIAMTAAVLLGYAKIDSAMIGMLIGYLSSKADSAVSYYLGGNSPAQMFGAKK